ncbi:MAG: hypothetical protein BWY17_01761 [Deltaproteobacteria bacterium ADurb.Bin207]|jgi:hypothetical protein|nr:MAG: hypothetical protein BWY17_01761 [Deltaproteobacteria bacterium ADurb.Bin207]HPY18335.1 hypothetical protein [Polyangiaceae bacterium]HQB42069.1 hypothetical protein [Polyangiaceae bacterium]
MVTMRFFIATLALTGLALQGCQLIGGIEERTLVLQDAGADNDWEADVQPEAEADVEPDVIDTTCELPTVGNASMRIGNLIPSLDRVEFCIKSANQTWQDVKPILAGSGGGCPRGLAYRSLSAAFDVQAGVYDVIAVHDPATGSRPACTVTPIAEASQIVISEGETMSLLVFGDSRSNASLRALKETKSIGVNETTVRFLHALVGASSLDMGVGSADELPADIISPVFSSVGFAGIAEAGNTPTGRIDENGYLKLEVSGGVIAFAVANNGSTASFMVKSDKYDRGVSYSFFAAGRKGDRKFPPEIMICDEMKADGIYTRCGGLPLTMTVDAANLQLAGAFGPYDKERIPAIQSAIASLPSDVVCVHESWGGSLRDGIAAAAASKFPHKASFNYDLDSLVDDATDQSGNDPPEWTEAPCAQSDTKIAAALDCIKANCVEPLGSEDGIPKVPLSSCLTSKCMASMLPLLGPDSNDNACYSCLFGNLAAFETVGYIRDQCSHNPKARFAHRGDSGVMVLSKHPVKNPESWVLASTEWRVNIVRAPVSLPNGAVVDVYCTQLTTPADSITRPYTGQYGDGKKGLEAWRSELYLQAHKLVSYVQSKSETRGRKAVVVGSIYSGPEYYDGEKKILEAVNPEAFNTVSTAFPLAVPASYVPVCTLCNDNLILAEPGSTPSGASTWQTFVFLSGIPITAVENAERFWTEPALEVESVDTGNKYAIPLSTHYGFRSIIRVLK